METSYMITGMTCKNCVAHVREEVLAIEAVSGVELDLSGSMIVISQSQIDFTQIEEAVAEAGNYQVSPS